MARVAELVWRSDNRSVIKDLKQIADQSDKTKQTVKKDSDETSASFDKVRHSSGLLRDSVKGLAGVIGFGGLAFGLKDAIQGGQQLQAAQAQLRTALGGSKTAFEQLSGAAERASTHGGFTTPQNLQTLTAFVRETHSASKAQQLFTLSTNIARGANMDLASAQSIVQSAEAGRARGLQKLLGPIAAATSAHYGLTQAHQQEILALDAQAKSMGKLGPLWLKQQEILHAITPQQAALAQLQDKNATSAQVISAAQTVFGGATGAFSQTTAGRLSNLQHALKNTTDTLGLKLLPVVNRLAAIALGVVSAFSHLPGPLQVAAVGIGALGALTPFVRNIVAPFKAAATWAGRLAGKEELAAGASEGLAGKEILGGTAAAAGGEGVGSVGLLAKFGEKFGLKGLGSVARFAGPIGLASMAIGTAINHIPFLSGLKHAPVLGTLSNILGFNRGGVVPRYMASGGPIGMDTVPAYLTPGEGVLSLQGMQALGQLNSGGGMGATEITIRVPVRLDSRVLTEAVAKYSLSRAARGPTSLVGGSLTTGGAMTFPA